MASLIKWFSTELGKKVSLTAGFTCGVAAFAVQWVPHNLLLDKYKEVLQLYKFGKPVPVPEELIAQAKEVQEDMRMKSKHREMINYFTIYGFDIAHIGSTQFNTGVSLGFPVSFSYKTPEDIDRQSIVVRNHHIDWFKPEALLLQSSLILSDSAKKFAMARELKQATTNEIMIHSLLNFSAFASYAYLSYTFNRKMNSFQRSLGFRGALYAILGLFCGTMWVLIRDLTTVYYEEWSDKEASLLGEQYALGAVEFYNKILQRNIALRVLLGDKEGPKYYTAFGNDHTLFRTPHMPFTARRDAAVLRYEAMAALQGKSPVAELVTV